MIKLCTNKDIINSLKQISKEESLILVATGQMIGEGFDFPRLDVLILASPFPMKAFWNSMWKELTAYMKAK